VRRGSNLKSVFETGLTSAFRLLGPTFGFLLGAGCLKLFVNPLLTPTIDTKHPRWIGAWWLGWIVLGSLMLTLTCFIALFPRELPRKNTPKSGKSGKKPENDLVKLSGIPLSVGTMLCASNYRINNNTAIKATLLYIIFILPSVD
jgi:hypothetical protein